MRGDGGWCSEEWGKCRAGEEEVRGKGLHAGRNGNRREEGGAGRGKGKMRDAGAPGTGYVAVPGTGEVVVPGMGKAGAPRMG
jgi:hypothetical protein